MASRRARGRSEKDAFVRGCIRQVLRVLSGDDMRVARRFLFNQAPEVDLACLADRDAVQAAAIWGFNGLEGVGQVTETVGGRQGHMLHVPYANVARGTLGFCTGVISPGDPILEHQETNDVSLARKENMESVSGAPDNAEACRGEGVEGVVPGSVVAESAAAPLEGQEELKFTQAEASAIRIAHTTARYVVKHATGDVLYVGEDQNSGTIAFLAVAPWGGGLMSSVQMHCNLALFAAGRLVESVMFLERVEYPTEAVFPNVGEEVDSTDFSDHIGMFRAHICSGRHRVGVFTAPVYDPGTGEKVQDSGLVWALTDNNVAMVESVSNYGKSVRQNLMAIGVQTKLSDSRARSVSVPLTALERSWLSAFEIACEEVARVPDGALAVLPERRRRKASMSIYERDVDDLSKEERQRLRAMERARKSYVKRKARHVALEQDLDAAKAVLDRLSVRYETLVEENVDIRRRLEGARPSTHQLHARP